MTRIGSLCTGYGGLDMAVIEVLGGSVAWHCQYEPPDKNGREDKHQYAARILEHHWPDIPNHGDLTKVDWTQVEPVDILTAGFPCTDISYAGLGAGIKEGTRSGLWLTIAGAIRALRPRLVVLENVRAITNRRPGLDVVLADLARLGLHAEWLCLPASGVGAPHERYRWFCLAWPADAAGPRLEGARLGGWPAGGGGAAADADRLGHERDRPAGQPAERHPAGTGRAPAHTARLGPGEPADQEISDTESREARTLPRCGDERTKSEVVPSVARGVAPNAPGDGRDEGRPEPAGILGRPDAALSGSTTPAYTHGNTPRHDRELPPRRNPVQQRLRDDTAGRRQDAPADADLGGLRAQQRDVREGQPDIDWGSYGPAIRRWEHILGRPAPRPTDDRGRLAAPFVEWMMGLPLGHVTDVPASPDMTAAGLRNARLKALGNGVVPRQAAHALRLLLARMAQPALIGATA